MKNDFGRSHFTYIVDTDGKIIEESWYRSLEWGKEKLTNISVFKESF